MDGLAYTEAAPSSGSGRRRRPILFVHGAGWAGISWHRQIAEFRHERPCIAVDLPGHGASRSTPWTTLDDVADRVAAVVADRVGGPVHLVGFSLGGDVGIRMLARHPELVDTALLTGVSTFAVPRAELVLDTVTWPLLATPLAHRALTRAMRLDATARRRHLETTAPVRVDDYRRISGQILRGADVSDIGAVASPVLVLAGALESGHARRSARDLAGRLPAGSWAHVPGAGHSWPVQRPAVFNLALRQWLAAPGTLPAVLRRP